MSSERKNNYDLLRIVAMFGVIMLHVSATYLTNICVHIQEGGTASNILALDFLNCIGRFAVPCFLMISGVFLLDNPKNKEFKYFYKKGFKRIVIPTIVFSIFYFVLYNALNMVGEKDVEFSTLVINLIQGRASIHLWYMYMLIGVYLLIPLVIRFKEDVGEDKFRIISYVLLPIFTIFLWTTHFELEYNLGYSFLFLPYVMSGYCINKNIHKRNKKFVIDLSVLIIIVSLATMTLLLYNFNSAGIFEESLTYPITERSPLILAYSVAIFCLFSVLSINKSFKTLAYYTFYIYLIHQGVVKILYAIFKRLLGGDYVYTDTAVWMSFVITAIAFVISLVGSIIYDKIAKLIETKIAHK